MIELLARLFALWTCSGVVSLSLTSNRKASERKARKAGMMKKTDSRSLLFTGLCERERAELAQLQKGGEYKHFLRESRGGREGRGTTGVRFY
jgi:hypothetical protein